MSGIKVLDFGNASGFGNLEFPDLEKHLEKRLRSVRSLPDLEQLIKMMNPFLKDERLSSEEQNAIKRLRQRAYDRKRHAKFQIPKAIAQSNRSKSQEPNLEEAQKQNAQKHLAIDPVIQAKKIIKPLAWFAATAIVSFFVWHQSIGLYHSAGFVSTTYAAAGGILMLVGFAACHSIMRSWLALLLCIYAGAYEGYLMISGTIADDKQIHVAAVNDDAELIFLQERMEKEKAHYQELKSRYENPESKVFKNDWFVKTYLNPAWDASTTAFEAYSAKKSSLMESVSDKHVTWLKILYRLGLVFLCMLLVHGFFTSCVGKNFSMSCANN